MFYNVVVNDWGETTYVPTTLGNILLAVVIIALLGVAMYFAGKGNKKVTKKLSAKQLAFCALAIAPVSYTHLDVYKRQVRGSHGESQESWQ